LNILTKISVVVLVLLVAVSCPVFITQATQQPNWKFMYEGSQQQVQLLSQDHRHGQVALQRAQLERDREKGRADGAEAKLHGDVTDLQRQLGDEKVRNAQLDGKLSSMESVLRQLRDDMKAKEDRNIDLVGKLDAERADKNKIIDQFRKTSDDLNREKLTSEKYQREVDYLRGLLRDADDRNAILTAQIKDRGQTPAGTGKDDGKPKPPPDVTGTITAVKRDMASINIGSAQGMKIGMELKVPAKEGAPGKSEPANTGSDKTEPKKNVPSKKS
jgi:hypothetical protein